MKVRIKSNLDLTAYNYGVSDAMWDMRGKVFEAKKLVGKIDRSRNPSDVFQVWSDEAKTERWNFHINDVELVHESDLIGASDPTPRSPQELVIDTLVLNYVLKFSDIGHTTLVNLSQVQVELEKQLEQLVKEDQVYTPAQLAAYLIARYVKETQ